MRRRLEFRERLVLGPIRRSLADGERVVAWTHATVPDVRAPGVLIVTDHHCVLHVASSATPDVWTPLSQLSRFTLDRHDPEIVRVHLVREDDEVHVELSLTNRLRSRSVGRVLTVLSESRVHAPESFDPLLTSPLPPMTRGVRQHARRVWVTVLGVLVLSLALLFTSPFVPGPGALTAVAGVAILAREYEWARDLHVWSARQLERFVAWIKRLRARRRDAQLAPSNDPVSGGRKVMEAEIAMPEHAPEGPGRDGPDREGPGRRAAAS